jgi:hypothetical protein
MTFRGVDLINIIMPSKTTMPKKAKSKFAIGYYTEK